VNYQWDDINHYLTLTGMNLKTYLEMLL